ncbi:GBF-interacting protein 1-like isoform X2 [Beta vulgaris subsp. vulgaris]|uniref:GBF-interacting protein 1-like isoform X2 n=1 Tax=Beta vulgaris subsp. vulgaris TaxID=3555 RepID=UPI000540198A|nr:GBF-interacting protein 1-like isoform X2 [Beta vulgaris subsp. vulgaris]
MVTLLKTEGGTQIVSAKVQKTIQSIKEIVGNHSDSEIYNTLQESNMDPNETAQKLLNQDPFHEVRRRRDKKKENAGYNDHFEPRKRSEYTSQGVKLYGSDRNVHRGGYKRSPVNGMSQEFRVVRDNRVNQNSEREAKPSTQASLLANVQRINNASERSSSVVPNYHRHPGRRFQTPNGMRDFRPKVSRDSNTDSRNGHFEKKSTVTGSESQVTLMKPNNLHSQAGGTVSSSAVGVYASASDPVHVPSPDSRSSTAIGAIRREVGVVGSRRQSLDNSSKQSLQQSNSNTNSVLGNSSAAEPFRQINVVSRNDQTHATAVEPVVVSSTGSRSSSHFNGRLHQQSVGHQKGALPGKEWKPKTNQKSIVSSPGVIGSPVKSVSHLVDNSKNVESEAEQLQDKLSQVNIKESQNVIIAQHIRVPENDRCRLTFGTFGTESDSAENPVSTFQAVDRVEEPMEPSSCNQQINSVHDQVRNSGSSSPSRASSENQSPEKKDSSAISNAEDFSDMGLVHNSSSLTGVKSQQHQESTDLSNFSAYDQQPVYDISYFRPSIDDAVRGSGLPSPQEALPSHIANNASASSVGMVQQQAHMAQMYPQVHLSHFANVMPYRQFIPPLYVPPMVPGFSGNPGYPHLSNGSSYVLMPGGSSHLPANSLKYGVQQFKPYPVGSPTGFGNMQNPNGYAINAPGVVGGPTGLDDSSRIKYKDNNLYVPNPQAETSEVWIPNHRDLPGMQQNPYFNMQGQTAHPAAAYLQSHTGHASFNGAGVAQSSQMQFPGMYPPQATGIPNAHHLGGGNIGVGVAPPAPGAQVGAYQQPQISHLNWTTNF